MEESGQVNNYGTVQLRKYLLCKIQAAQGTSILERRGIASKSLTSETSLPLINLHQGQKKVRTFIADWKGEMKRR